MGRLSFVLAVALVAAPGCGGSNNKGAPPSPAPAKGPKDDAYTLNFGVYTTDLPTEMYRQFRPVLDLLEKHASETLAKTVKIEMKIRTTYQDGIQDLVDGKVDFARFGPESYVHARDKNPKLRLLAMELEQGKKVFYGVICVHKDSPIKSAAELRGKSFAFGDYGSTIGRLLAVKYLIENGVTEKDLARWDYLGRHDKVGAAVALGTFDAGALNEKTFLRLVKEGKEIRELVRFENVTKPWIARAGLDDPVFQALKKGLLAIRDDKAFAALGFTGIAAANDADYAAIRTALKITEDRFPPRDAKD